MIDGKEKERSRRMTEWFKGWLLEQQEDVAERYILRCNRCGQRAYDTSQHLKVCGQIQFGHPGSCTGRFEFVNVDEPVIMRLS
jgi:hypothetical protein